MDIFTTQLGKVVAVPIKPANLKVKALLKEAPTSELKEDHDHLENHDYYFISSKKNAHDNSAEKTNKNPNDKKIADESDAIHEEKKSAKEGIYEDDDNKTHLDIYV